MALTAHQINAFVKAHALPEDEARMRAAHAVERSYWTSLVPHMSIGRQRPPGVQGDPPDDVMASIREYRQSGYCGCVGVFETGALARLEEAIRIVHGAGWPLAFAFVYDEFWTVLQAPKLDAFLRVLLGPDYQTTARFLVNYVSAVPGASGFPPHVDGGLPHTVTCWVPLTPASPDNGCMYVVERTAASNASAAAFRSSQTLSKKEMLLLLAHARALPLVPGGFLAWPQDTIHWGGLYRSGHARVALSWEFMDASRSNIDAALPLALHSDRPLPRFEDRLRWIRSSVSKTMGRDIALARFERVLELIHQQIQGPQR